MREEVRPGLYLRQARQKDGQAVMALVFGILEEYGLSGDSKTTDADLQDLEGVYEQQRGWFAVVEDAAGDIVGSVGLARIDEQSCELRKMYLHRCVRGLGLGRLLLERSLRQARLLGYQRIVLETASSLKKALVLYKHVGFTPVQGHHLASRCDQAMELWLEPGQVSLREVHRRDLEKFWGHQQDKEARWMTAFTSAEADREEFDGFWKRLLANDGITKRTILYGGEVVGNVTQFTMFEKPQVGYWIGRKHWGKGVGTEALKALLLEVTTRPLYAQVAKDNLGSLRVLEKNGFAVIGEDKGFADARGEEIEEFILRLDG